MESSHWLRIITIGLVLAALAVGYFLVSGSFGVKKVSQPEEKQVEGVTQASPPLTQPSPSPVSAYSRIVERNKTQVETLPRTGIPVLLYMVFSASAIISGLALRKFPK